MGQAGRETAQKVFHIDNFVRQWNELLRDRMEGTRAIEPTVSTGQMAELLASA